MGKSEKMLSIKEIANILNVSEKTIRRHIRSGKIKSSKLGGTYRISKDEVLNLVKPITTKQNQKYNGF